jgi:hypothetical protein
LLCPGGATSAETDEKSTEGGGRCEGRADEGESALIAPRTFPERTSLKFFGVWVVSRESRRTPAAWRRSVVGGRRERAEGAAEEGEEEEEEIGAAVPVLVATSRVDARTSDAEDVSSRGRARIGTESTSEMTVGREEEEDEEEEEEEREAAAAHRAKSRPSPPPPPVTHTCCDGREEDDRGSERAAAAGGAGAAAAPATTGSTRGTRRAPEARPEPKASSLSLPAADGDGPRSPPPPYAPRSNSGLLSTLCQLERGSSCVAQRSTPHIDDEAAAAAPLPSRQSPAGEASGAGSGAPPAVSSLRVVAVAAAAASAAPAAATAARLAQATAVSAAAVSSRTRVEEMVVVVVA